MIFLREGRRDSGVRGAQKSQTVQNVDPMFRPDGSHAASFTDDTSLPHVGCRVSIHAQIIKENQISWYFQLRGLVHNGQDEFKDQAARTFFSLPTSNRAQIFRTLRTVRIHITDPRPYTADLEDVLRKVLPSGTTVHGFIRRLDDSTIHLSQLREATRDLVATLVLYDSPAQRLLRTYHAWERATGQRIDFLDDETSGMFVAEKSAPPADLDAFRHKHANVLNDVANFVSASASVFSPAMDKLEEAPRR